MNAGIAEMSFARVHLIVATLCKGKSAVQVIEQHKPYGRVRLIIKHSKDNFE